MLKSELYIIEIISTKVCWMLKRPEEHLMNTLRASLMPKANLWNIFAVKNIKSIIICKYSINRPVPNYHYNALVKNVTFHNAIPDSKVHGFDMGPT